MTIDNDSNYTLTTKDAALLLGISLKTLFRWIKKHNIPYKQRIGQNGRPIYVFSEKELLEYRYVRKKALEKVSEPKRTPVKEETEVAPVKEDMSMMVITTLKDQVASLEKQISFLNEMIFRKDEQISELSSSNMSLLAIHQRELKSIEYHGEKEKPSFSKATKKERASLKTRIKRLREKGKSKKGIAKILNSESIPTLSGRGAWAAGVITRILNDES